MLAGLFALVATASGCAKNVDKIEFNKWGNSYIPKGNSIDTSAQGGAPVGGSTNGRESIPKASLGGTYQRATSVSPHYRLVGGFHSNSTQ